MPISVKLEVIVEVAVKSRAEAVIKVGVQLLLLLGGMWGKWLGGGWVVGELKSIAGVNLSKSVSWT